MIEKIDCLDSQFVPFCLSLSLNFIFLLRRPHSGLTDRDVSGNRQSASRRLGQRQGTLVLTAPVHVSVRLGLVKRAPENHRGPVCRRRRERVLVRGAGGGRRRGRAGRGGGALGRRGALLRGGQRGSEGLQAGGRLQRNVLHGSHVLHVQLFRVRRFVLLAVEEAHLLETRLQVVLDAADDLQKGRPHFGVVLPAHAHQFKPESAQEHTKRSSATWSLRNIKISCCPVKMND